MFLQTRKCWNIIVLVAAFNFLLYLFFLSPRTLPSLSSHDPLFDKGSARRYAYATFLGPPTSHTSNDNETNSDASSDVVQDPYFISVRLLNYQIKHAKKTKTHPSAPFLVLVLPNVPPEQTDILGLEGATIVPIEPLDLPDVYDKDFIIHSRFRDVLSKLRLWQLTDYDKILYLDADSFLLENLDDIFTDPELSLLQATLPPNSTEESERSGVFDPPETYLMAASSDTYGDQTEWETSGHINYLCACFMLIAPSAQLFSYYLSVLSSPEAPQNAAYPEQDLLIHVHRKEGRMPWRRIPVSWSANDGEMDEEAREIGGEGVRSLHVKGWEGAEGGNVASERWSGVWKDLVGEMETFWRENGVEW